MTPAPSDRRARGQRAEDLAAAHLEREGLRVVERNAYAGRGEIDIIAEEPARAGSPGEAVLCFVEVRARASADYGTPEATVSTSKRKKLERAAQAWLSRHPPPWPRCRFDVVAVAGPEGDERVRYVRHAFSATGAS